MSCLTQNPPVILAGGETSLNASGSPVSSSSLLPGQEVNPSLGVCSDDYKVEEFPPLLGSPLRRTDLPPSMRNAWEKPPFPATRNHHRLTLRYIPPATRDNMVVGVCSKSAVAGEIAVLDYTLVGFFFLKKPSFSYVRAVLLRQWKLKGTVEILQLIHGGFAFRFSELSDRDNILEGNVYYIGGQPLFIRQWEMSLHNGGILGLKKVPLRVSLTGLPLHLWGEECLSAIGFVLGNPLYSDSTTAMKNQWIFARICVEFSGENPLLDSISIEDDEGNMFQQAVKYEWKPPHCLVCGVFGHPSNACLLKPSEADSRIPLDPDVNQKDEQLLEKNRTERDGEQLGSKGALQPGKSPSNRDSGIVGDIENQWNAVRVKKKKSSGSREHLWIPTRPGSGLPMPGQSSSTVGHV